MTESTRRGTETIPLFPIGSTFYFKHYFEDQDLFGELSQFYNDREYRFEVPESSLPEVREILDGEDVQLTPVEDFDDYLVVKEKYTDHPDVLFKKSVLKTDDAGYNVFLMQDRTAVTAALTSGATPFEETSLSFDP